MTEKISRPLESERSRTPVTGLAELRTEIEIAKAQSHLRRNRSEGAVHISIEQAESIIAAIERWVSGLTEKADMWFESARAWEEEAHRAQSELAAVRATALTAQEASDLFAWAQLDEDRLDRTGAWVNPYVQNIAAKLRRISHQPTDSND